MLSKNPSKSLLGRCLLVVAAPAEAQAVLAGLGNSAATETQLWTPRPVSDRFDLVVTGISKANAAGAVARAANPDHHRLIVNIGVAGALPGSGLAIADVVISSGSVFADEGLESPQGFKDCAAMGFPLGTFAGSAVPVSKAANGILGEALRSVMPRLGGIATVSTCSGTDSLARQVVARTAAIAEGMEGAAVGLVAHHLGIEFSEVRVISNTTGNRDAQIWDLKKALARLEAVIALLARV